MRHLSAANDWSIEGILFQLEAYNGWGYRNHHGINTPYLWSGSNQYTSGKYVADGKFDPTAVSKQIGGALLLKYLL
jgi:lysozyme family protein